MDRGLATPAEVRMLDHISAVCPLLAIAAGFSIFPELFAMRFFIAGIMQGSHTVNHMHDQEYRQRITQLLEEHFPGAEIYDPLAKHKNSLDYDKLTGREVFFRHNLMCREVDVLLAFIPEASMGTAIEMWEAHQHGAAILTISPMKHNWTVKFLSHGLYADEAEFIAALRAGDVARKIETVRGAS
jgi:hypothetical protein